MLNQYDIEKEFNNMVNDSVTECQSVKDYLEYINNYGGQDEYTFYSDTTKLYDEYKSDCDDWLYNQVEETGLKPWDLFDDWDYVPDSEQNKWIVIVAMFEEYCRDRLEQMED